MIVESDWSSLDYFWSEKGDLTRWVGWEDFRAKNPSHPIVQAWDRHLSAEETLTLLIRGSRP